MVCSPKLITVVGSGLHKKRSNLLYRCLRLSPLLSDCLVDLCVCLTEGGAEPHTQTHTHTHTHTHSRNVNCGQDKSAFYIKSRKLFQCVGVFICASCVWVNVCEPKITFNFSGSLLCSCWWCSSLFIYALALGHWAKEDRPTSGIYQGCHTKIYIYIEI